MTDDMMAAGNLDNSSGGDFFEQVENAVNSGIQDQQVTTEATPPITSGSEQVTHNQPSEGSNNSVDWEKRYKDSQRGAQAMNNELKTLKPFVPVLNAMKQDSGLVQHVRDYFEGGGAPVKSVQERLGLAEDFVYDQTEALENPDSDSAKVFNAHVDSMVNGRDNLSLLKKSNKHNKHSNRFKGKIKKRILGKEILI